MFELNMDGLVGPTHHYAGLASGNIASMTHALHQANPAAAAHQGIEKMRFLHRLGLKQGFLPPHPRPNLTLLKQLGFTGTPAKQVRQAKKTDLALLSACYSSSSMWTANAATVTPSVDTLDKKVHFTAANLISHLHRHQEAFFSQQLLTYIFADPTYFYHHPPLPSCLITRDEGAANHNRLCATHSASGIYLFIYGKKAMGQHPYALPTQFPARQTLEASEGIARSHLIPEKQVFFACQTPSAIDQGVFHNDVLGVSNENVLFVHEKAWVNQSQLIDKLQQLLPFPWHYLEISNELVSIPEAVSSYLFNSQLLTLPHSKTGQPEMALIAPIECQENHKIRTVIEEIIANAANPITTVHYLNLRQSMNNGGGPACLRLRIPLTTDELAAMHQGFLLDDNKLDSLDAWVDKHYRTNLHATDLDDPQLIDESYRALDELTQLFKLGSIYPFQ